MASKIEVANTPFRLNWVECTVLQTMPATCHCRAVPSSTPSSVRAPSLQLSSHATAPCRSL
eukprot:2491221-Amphidinium_carterae.1